jgi:hypothetical protein
MRPLVLEYPQAVRVERADPHFLDNRLPAVAKQGRQAHAHLIGGLFGECRHKQPLGFYPFGEETCDPTGQNGGFSTACPGQD